ncbi:hypothetical protein ABFS83_09G117700 [Erythranthe nasuta]
MALVREIMGSSVMEKSPFLTTRLLFSQQKNRVFLPLHGKNVQQRGLKSTTPVAAISEGLDLVKVLPEKAVKFKVRAVLTVRNKNKEDFKDTLVKHLDAFTDKIGKNVVLQLISTDIDPKTKAPMKSSEAKLKDWSKKANLKTERVNYTAEFTVDSNFGTPGAITVCNNHQQEFFLESITIEGFACGPQHFPCNSWVQSKKDHPGKRIFFSNQPYLPNETPKGLKALREKELREQRGDGKGERKLSDRVYDFDVYNDLGNPDKGIDSARPILGGAAIPYPRRCRTGRPPTDTDLNSESRVEKPLPMYVPRDEQFEESKMNAFSTGRLKAVLHNLIPSLMASISVNNKDFKGFSDIDSLYSKGLFLKLGLHDEILKKIPMPKAISKIQEGGLLKYDLPKIVSKDKYAWLRDDEFARQAIAGVNPVNIERLQVFPPVSKLDPEIYGPKESAIKEEHIAGQLNGMTIQEALDANKLFIIDYHDVYLPFLDKMNALDGRKSYATRTLFFLSDVGTLKPIAIELSLPSTASPTSKTKRVLTPPVDATTYWMWQLAKSHVCSNDAGVHQLVNHWLRTHATMEPFILAAHRQLSAMHPIFKLLDPHMRYTLEINALARQSLISVDGVIESCFTPGRYCMELSAAAYKNFWRFDQEGLPADLIRRGMAVPDPTLATPDDLTSILTTLIWLASAQHAALNFGQYPYGGYVPNRPPLVRRLIPDENDPEYAVFLSDPQKYFFSALPSLLQATKFMAVVDTLSTHSPDEEYLGERHHQSIWSGDARVIESFYEFSAEMGRVEKEIDRRNMDPKLRNRCGAGVLPYELLAPTSEPGVTGRGVPNSVSI